MKKEKLTQMQMEKALNSSAKLCALGEMAGSIAHEINTPLSIIQLKIELLEEAISEGNLDKDKVLETLKTIRATTDRITKIVQGIKYFSRDAERTPIETISIPSVIDETLSFCLDKFRSYGINFEIKNHCASPAYIEGRSVEISQVLLNVLNNAIDAVDSMPERWIRLELEDTETDVKIHVLDSGSGVPPQIQEKIMEAFFTTKNVGKGTGLGLSISKGLVEAHKGQFFLNTKSKETCFTIALPKAPSNLDTKVA